MRRAAILMSVVVMFSLSITGADALQTYTVNWYNGTNPSYGGPFTINPEVGENFLSFCLEDNEYISWPPSTYYGTIDAYALYGGVYSDSWGGTPGGPLTKDILDDNTKKLYSYALDNNLSLAQLQALQYAIWAYEGEINPSSLQGDAKTYYVNAPNYILDRNVMVLNLWTSDTTQSWNTRAQSMLIEVPVPEPGTLLFLGAGLLSLGFVVRRRKS